MRASITTLLLALAVAAVWFCWRPDVEPAPASAPGTADPVTPVAAPPTVAAGPPGAPRVEVSWTVVARLAPPLAADRLVVTRGGRATPEAIGIIAGNGTGLLERDERDGRALVAIDTHDRRRLHRIVAYTAAASLPVEVGTPVRVRGHVLDDAGSPVAGVRVHACEQVDGEFDEAITDAEGAFVMSVTAGAGVPLVATATGHATSHLVLDVLGDLADLTLTLAPESVVEVQLQALARELAAAQVFVLPGREPTTELLRYPAFLAALHGGVPTDEHGRCVVRGLPRGATVGLIVQHPLAAMTAPVSVRLVQAVTPAALPLVALPEVAGRIVDDQGAPVADAWVVARPTGKVVQVGAAARRLMPALLEAEGCAVAVSDADGRFRVGRVGESDWTLAVRSFVAAGIDIPMAAGQGLASELTLPRWSAPPHLLRVPPPVTDQAWAIRIGDAAEFVSVAANEVFAVPFEQPGVARVRMVVERAGGKEPERIFDRITIVGTTDLPR
ncbi:MAG: carboxypeptidase regulatory-like domain-containing protein [Planctomycetes bacterium]|nr:carboxypeptidase regulatory-like domain-containing protein [Planctomycetota bacterium]